MEDDETDECIFKRYLNCTSNNESVICLTKTRLLTINEASKLRDDDLHLSIKQEVEYVTHKSCVSTYTSRTHINRYLKRQTTSSASTSICSKRTRRSETNVFRWLEHCLFCSCFVNYANRKCRGRRCRR
jgi:hypothetical protein